MHKVKTQDYLFAIEIVKSKIHEEEKRFDLFNQKLHFYLIFMTVTGTLITLLINTIVRANLLAIFNFTAQTYYKIGIKIFISIIVTGLIITIFIAIFKLINKILIALKPITLMTPDLQSVDIILKKGENIALKTYLNDLIKSLKSNQKEINDKYDILEKINISFEEFWIVFFIFTAILLTVSVVINLKLCSIYI